MKTIEVDEELYRYIASQTQQIGESASDILRRLLMASASEPVEPVAAPEVQPVSQGIVVSKDAGKSVDIDRTKEMRSLLISDELAKEDKAIGRFMLVLTSLYRIDPQGFSDAAAIKGRTRVYFASDEETLLASGKTTKPKAIPETPFWVITNTNTGRKRQMVEQLMERMRFDSDIIEKVCAAI
ncbi:replication initiation negative regulator SeqA [Thaumasiovibrio subtropicus]|uniref:replication initiation negative regulator SeqA n=1 Tax=Thaumasiovibrio subtropicus TaxID=1891207 RepID=UPI000B34BD3E|nr:replication initiation negative regulator SeqA [Thaumasiovibrio subtropicus]